MTKAYISKIKALGGISLPFYSIPNLIVRKDIMTIEEIVYHKGKLIIAVNLEDQEYSCVIDVVFDIIMDSVSFKVSSDHIKLNFLDTNTRLKTVYLYKRSLIVEYDKEAIVSWSVEIKDYFIRENISGKYKGAWILDFKSGKLLEIDSKNRVFAFDRCKEIKIMHNTLYSDKKKYNVKETSIKLEDIGLYMFEELV